MQLFASLSVTIAATAETTKSANQIGS